MQGHDYQMAAFRTVPKEFDPIFEPERLSIVQVTLRRIASVGEFADGLKKHLFHGHAFTFDSEPNIDHDKIENRRDLMLVNAVLGFAGEGGEFASHFEKYLFHGEAFDPQYLEKELGDKLWYIALACTALNVSMDAIMEQNIEKLKRRYPEGFSHEASINRKE